MSFFVLSICLLLQETLFSATCTADKIWYLSPTLCNLEDAAGTLGCLTLIAGYPHQSVLGSVVVEIRVTQSSANG